MLQLLKLIAVVVVVVVKAADAYRVRETLGKLFLWPITGLIKGIVKNAIATAAATATAATTLQQICGLHVTVASLGHLIAMLLLPARSQRQLKTWPEGSVGMTTFSFRAATSHAASNMLLSLKCCQHFCCLLPMRFNITNAIAAKKHISRYS